jgi:hypothetical protein
MRVLE